MPRIGSNKKIPPTEISGRILEIAVDFLAAVNLNVSVAQRLAVIVDQRAAHRVVHSELKRIAIAGFAIIEDMHEESIVTAAIQLAEAAKEAFHAVG